MWCYLVILNISLIFAQSEPLLLVVSFDGFRHDYPKLHGPLKNFRRLEQRGVHAQNMISTFTTATFPNHYTLITGLYEEVHGLISNNMFDPKMNVTFESSGNMTNGDWWPYPTIWSINEQRKGARSGVVGWPQDPISISKYQSYRRARSFRDIIDQILLWFNDPIEPINFGAIYHHEPDLTGHRTGPYSINMTNTVRECDEHLGYLLDKIDTNEKLRENLHLIVTSDHGMEQINGTDNPRYFEDYVDERKVKAFGIPPVMNIFVRSSNDIDIVLKNLSKIPHSQSYKRKDIPDRYHYKNHERIGDILLVFEAGYEIYHHPSHGGKKYNLTLVHGNHGYDNQLDSMKTIFYASGPQLKKNFTLENSSLLYNIDIFGLMCIILNIKKCPPSNGSLENIQPFLIDPKRVIHFKKKIIYLIEPLASYLNNLCFVLAIIGFGLILLTAIICSFISCLTVINKTSLTSPPLLLLISFDGFRWDYPDLYKLPHFNSLINRGVRVKYIDNNFATVTFPLHFTMVTGLYEETHGIVANAMYDPKLNATTTMDTMNDTKWWSQNPYSQPIWVSNQLSNDSNQRRSGVIAWPGVDTPINGHLPYKYLSYNSTRTFNSTLQQILDWFHEPIETRINFGVIYYFEPDKTGHHYGPISNEMNKTLIECDNYLGQLLQIIDNDKYLKTNLNVIITSDHGMQEIKKNHTIKLEDYIDTSLFKAYGGRTYVNIFVHSTSNIDQIYRNLSAIRNYEVFKKSQIPDEYHYKSNVRIGDILFIGKVGYEIIIPGDNSSIELLGDHGYNSQVESMRPIFYGFGPVFRENFHAEPFHSVDIYPLMSYILHLEERKTNGSLDNVKHILKDFSFNKINLFVSKITMQITNWGLLTVGCVILVILTSIIYTIVACRYSRQLIYVEAHYAPVRYRLLSNNEGSTNNLVVSESEIEEEIS